MSPDINDTLKGAARSPIAPVDPTDLRLRGSRRRTGQVLGGTAMVLVVAIAGVTAMTGGAPDSPPVIAPAPTGEASDRPSPAEPTATGTPVPDDGAERVDAVGLGQSVATMDESGAVLLVSHADGTSSRVAVGEAADPDVTWYAAPDGGFWWQDQGETVTAGSPAIWLTMPEHGASVVVPATTSHDESWQLVGSGFATHRTGTSPDDMNVDLHEIGPDGSTSLVRQGVAGWESGLGTVSGEELLLWSLSAEGFSLAVHSPPDRPNVTVYEGGEINGEYVEGIAHINGGTGAVLVTAMAGYPDWPTAQILLSDLEGNIQDALDVPVDLGTSTWNAPQVISAQGNQILVNRYAEGTWIEPLVFDFKTYQWRVYTTAGLAQFATAALSTPPPTSACATEYLDTRQLPPTGGPQWLYWACDGDGDDPWVLHRAVQIFLDEGSLEARLNQHLGLLLRGPDSVQRDDGYWGPEGLEATLNAVTVEGTRATIDISTASGHLGSFSTSHGGSVWATLLASTVFQHDGIEEFVMQLDGSCAKYAAQFETGTDDCIVTTLEWATWNR